MFATIGWLQNNDKVVTGHLQFIKLISTPSFPNCLLNWSSKHQNLSKSKILPHYEWKTSRYSAFDSSFLHISPDHMHILYAIAKTMHMHASVCNQLWHNQALINISFIRHVPPNTWSSWNFPLHMTVGYQRTNRGCYEVFYCFQ